MAVLGASYIWVFKCVLTTSQFHLNSHCHKADQPGYRAGLPTELPKVRSLEYIEALLPIKDTRAEGAAA
jgi:hypothetical protein